MKRFRKLRPPALLVRIVAPLLLLAACAPAPEDTAQPSALSAIDRVWSGHEVGFDLIVGYSHVYAGYFDANRQLTLAERPVNANRWTYHKLDSWLGWDSHNDVALGLDREGRVHVAANMHGDPLIYFRARTPGDVRTLERVEVMVDRRLERRMTYPRFFNGAGGELLFSYRAGRAGGGNAIFNVYDEATGDWRPLHRDQLIDGEDERNAYPDGPVRGPDGRFHMAWVWRDTNDAATNHSLSYAASDDLVDWTDSGGAPLNIPITFDSGEIVDPVPPGGGMINNNVKIGFDRSDRVMIAYHKFDAEGDTEIHLARHEAEGWKIAQASGWDGFRWEFGGRGALDFRVHVGRPRPAEEPGLIAIPVVQEGRPRLLVVNEITLQPVAERDHAPPLVAHFANYVETPDGLRLNAISDLAPGDVAACFAMVWAAAPQNRDRPRADIPEPSTLRFAELPTAACVGE